MPEAYFDAATNAIKPEFADLVKQALPLLEAQKAKAEHLPKDPDGYEFAAPKDYKVPDGMKLDPKHPLVPMWRKFAHENGLPQEQFSAGVAMWGDFIAQAYADKAAYDAAETKKLGTDGPTRVTAAKTFWKSYGGSAGEALFTHDLTASQFELLERIQSDLVNSGVARYSANGREVPEPAKPTTFADRVWPGGFKAPATQAKAS